MMKMHVGIKLYKSKNKTLLHPEMGWKFACGRIAVIGTALCAHMIRYDYLYKKHLVTCKQCLKYLKAGKKPDKNILEI